MKKQRIASAKTPPIRNRPSNKDQPGPLELKSQFIDPIMKPPRPTAIRESPTALCSNYGAARCRIGLNAAARATVRRHRAEARRMAESTEVLAQWLVEWGFSV